MITTDFFFFGKVPNVCKESPTIDSKNLWILEIHCLSDSLEGCVYK